MVNVSNFGSLMKTTVVRFSFHRASQNKQQQLETKHILLRAVKLYPLRSISEVTMNRTSLHNSVI